MIDAAVGRDDAGMLLGIDGGAPDADAPISPNDTVVAAPPVSAEQPARRSNIASPVASATGPRHRRVRVRNPVSCVSVVAIVQHFELAWSPSRIAAPPLASIIPRTSTRRFLSASTAIPVLASLSAIAGVIIMLKSVR